MTILLPESSQTTAQSLTPRQIVAELDKHVVGQGAAKRAVAIALRAEDDDAAGVALREAHDGLELRERVVGRGPEAEEEDEVGLGGAGVVAAGGRAAARLGVGPHLREALGDAAHLAALRVIRRVPADARLELAELEHENAGKHGAELDGKAQRLEPLTAGAHVIGRDEIWGKGDEGSVRAQGPGWGGSWE